MSKYLFPPHLFFILLTFFIPTDYVFGKEKNNNHNFNYNNWNIKKAEFFLRPDFENKKILGKVSYHVTMDKFTDTFFFFLYETMIIDSAHINQKTSPLNKIDKTLYSVIYSDNNNDKNVVIELFFQGKPKESLLPPWQGGVNWGKDSLGRKWLTTSCQTDGSQVWLPIKKDLSDKYDTLIVHVEVEDNLTAVSNGKLIKKEKTPRGSFTFSWLVTSPIINYNLTINVGHYQSYDTSIQILTKDIPLSLFFLDYNIEKAKHILLPEIHRTLDAFSTMLTPYPFINDGFKLVEVNYLGMEHQSAVAYGNGFKKGYKGMDLSNTGLGLLMDFIIIHETGHEWFGNSLSMKNYQDMWLHESFTSYLESLFLEYFYGRDTAEKYLIGKRALIQNDKPIYPKHKDSVGSGDMYFKGESLVMGFRYLINNDKAFFDFLKALLTKYRFHSLNTYDFLDFVKSYFNKDYSWYFLEYLTKAELPILIYFMNKKATTFNYKWDESVRNNFSIPIDVVLKNKDKKIYPKKYIQSIPIKKGDNPTFKKNSKFLFQTKEIYNLK